MRSGSLGCDRRGEDWCRRLLGTEIPRQMPELWEIYRCCADTLQDAYDLSYEQEQTIKGIQSQIEDIAPDIMDQIQSQDRQRFEQETQFMK